MTTALRWLALGFVLLLGTAPQANAAATACTGSNGICALSGTTCTVNSQVEIQAGATINCTGYDVVVNRRVYVTAGTFTLKARNVTVNSSYKIEAVPHAIVRTGFTLELTGALTVNGQLLARNGGGDSYIRAYASGNINLSSGGLRVDAGGTSTSAADGGEIVLNSGGTIFVNGRVNADGHLSGGDTAFSLGGWITLSAATDILIYEDISAAGLWFQGGVIDLVAGRDVIVLYQAGSGTPKGELIAEGRAEDGYGGYVTVIGGRAVTISGPLNVRGGSGSSGGTAAGGDVWLEAGCGGVTIASDVTATGGEIGGGGLDISSDGNVTISGVIDLSGIKLGGDGGIVDISSGGRIVLSPTGSILASGHTSTVPFYGGYGGFAGLTGCQVDMNDGAVIAVDGWLGGDVYIDGAKEMLGDVTDYSVRVNDGAILDASGVDYAGIIELGITEPRYGVCATAPSTCHQDPDQPSCIAYACDRDSDCTIGWTPYDCLGASPDIDGKTGHFLPELQVSDRYSLPPCNVPCS